MAGHFDWGPRDGPQTPDARSAPGDPGRFSTLGAPRREPGRSSNHFDPATSGSRLDTGTTRQHQAINAEDDDCADDGHEETGRLHPAVPNQPPAKPTPQHRA